MPHCVTAEFGSPPPMLINCLRQKPHLSLSLSSYLSFFKLHSYLSLKMNNKFTINGHFILLETHKRRMATTNKPPVLFLLCITFIFAAQLLPGMEAAEGWVSQSSDQPQREPSLEGSKEEWRNFVNRRMMIGSTVPTCTYNECKGCKHKCSAEQVPVEGNDPLNSPYHYRCVCH